MSDQLTIEPGKVHTARIYFHNDAAPTATGSIATGVRLNVQMVDVMTGSTAPFATLTSDNAQPRAVWDGVTLIGASSSSQAALRYVSDSAKLHVGGSADGTQLDGNDLFSSRGVTLGCDHVDGAIPSGDRCAGFVTFEFRVDQPDFVVTALAKIEDSDSPFSDHVTVHVGDVVEVRLMFQNTGTSQFDNVILCAILPASMTYVDGSSERANSLTNGEYTPLRDGIADRGINEGSFQPMGNVFVKFDVTIQGDAITSSTWLSVPSFARATTSAGYKEAPMTFALLG